MTDLEWKERISISPNVCHGKPCIKGTRIMVSVILDCLKAQDSAEAIIREYPSLSEADIRAAFAYAVWLAHEEDVLPLHTEVTA